MLRLFTDTDCDVTPALAKEYGYSGLISMPYSIDGVTVYPYKDEDYVFDAKPFYDSLRAGTLPTTSAIPAAAYIEYIEPVFAAGDDILYVHFSREMSASFGNLDKALAQLKERYPERTCYLLDTRSATTCALNVALSVGELFLAGKTAEEILAWAETEVDKHAMYFFADDLKFFHRSGRVGGLSAFMGSLLGVRPIIYMSQRGKMETFAKARGRNNALNRLITAMEEIGEDVANHRVIVGHTDADPAIIEELISMIRERFGKDLPIMVQMVNPTLGSHSGPDGIAVSFYAQHR